MTIFPQINLKNIVRDKLKIQIEKFLQTGATAPREERIASCHEGGHSDREGGEFTFVMMMRRMMRTTTTTTTTKTTIIIMMSMIIIMTTMLITKLPGFGRLTPQLSFASYSNNEEGQVGFFFNSVKF